MNNSQARARHYEAAKELRAETEQRRVLREAARVSTDEPDIVTDEGESIDRSTVERPALSDPRAASGR